jgi:hypothetical protein
MKVVANKNAKQTNMDYYNAKTNKPKAKLIS